MEIVEGDKDGDGVALMSLGKRKRTAVSKDGVIVMNEINNRDSNLKARLRECLRKFCLSPAGVFYFQGFKSNFIGRIVFLIFKKTHFLIADVTRQLVLEKCNGLTSAQWESIVREDSVVGHFFDEVVGELRHKLSANACRLFKVRFFYFCINYN